MTVRGSLLATVTSQHRAAHLLQREKARFYFVLSGTKHLSYSNKHLSQKLLNWLREATLHLPWRRIFGSHTAQSHRLKRARRELT